MGVIQLDLLKLFTEENVGGLDLMVRSFLGSAAIVVLALGWVSPPWRYVVALIAFVGLYTGMTRHCTPYVLIGLSTARKK